MENNHTPGPWTAVEFEQPIGGCTHEIQHGRDGEVVCENVYGKENAKLIAAAPELLEALKAAKAIFESQGINIGHRICGEQYRTVIVAIQKAKA